MKKYQAKCPNCGAQISFTSRDKKIKCPNGDYEKANSYYSEDVDEDYDFTPEYVAKKSTAALTGKIIFGILFFWLLLIPTIKMIAAIIEYHNFTVEIYKRRIVIKEGVFNIVKKEQSRTGIVSVTKTQSLWGNICGYGDLHINLVGKDDLYLQNIKDPDELKSFLQKSIINGRKVKQVMFD